MLCYPVEKERERGIVRKRTYTEVLTAGLIAGGLSVFVLYPGLQGYQAIQQGKFGAFCALFGGYLVLMALFSLELWLTGRIRPAGPEAVWKRWTPAKKLVAFYWTWTVLSAAVSPFWTQTLVGMTRNEGLLTITLYCGCFFCVSEYGRPRGWMMHLVSGVMTLFSGYCLMQMAGCDPLRLYPAGYGFQNANVDYAGVYLGTIGNADLTAALLCLAIPAMGIWLLAGKERSRLWSLLPLSLSLAALWKMQVQAGLLAAAVSAFVILPLALPWKGKSRKGLWLASGALAAALLAGIYVMEPPGGTLYELHQVLHGRWDPEMGNARVFIWREVLSRVPAHLFLGTGPDTMAAAGISYYSRVVEGVSIPVMVDTAHNEYLNILYHQGLPALLAYGAALGSSLVSWLRRGRTDTAAAICGGALLCYGIQAFFSFSMCQTAGVFWLVWGMFEYRKTEGKR